MHARLLLPPGSPLRPAAPTGGRARSAAPPRIGHYLPQSCPAPCGLYRTARARTNGGVRRWRSCLADFSAEQQQQHLNGGVGSARLQLQGSRVGLEGGGEATQVLIAGCQPLPGSCRVARQRAPSAGSIRTPTGRWGGLSCCHSAPTPHSPASLVSVLSAVWNAVTPSSNRSAAASK